MDNPGTGDEATPATRPTRFSDVCGTIDELKRLHEEPAAAALLDTLRRRGPAHGGAHGGAAP